MQTTSPQTPSKEAHEKKKGVKSDKPLKHSAGPWAAEPPMRCLACGTRGVPCCCVQRRCPSGVVPASGSLHLRRQASHRPAQLQGAECRQSRSTQRTKKAHRRRQMRLPPRLCQWRPGAVAKAAWRPRSRRPSCGGASGVQVPRGSRQACLSWGRSWIAGSWGPQERPLCPRENVARRHSFVQKKCGDGKKN